MRACACVRAHACVCVSAFVCAQQRQGRGRIMDDTQTQKHASGQVRQAVHSFPGGA